ncbi:[protein-PII] uridylyltransferase [Janthinobacterium lividum]|uniref:Bifunctional uridylyltransferase/uridylyl-removing enzyme n=1 Tax=Janthinobacterium lividum TaxID=29581 RepID=A0ABU0Y2A0_9BURK|nr:[protein-PII] uridylyltransferase [Janthinobacterium lividum]MDQ4629320.1 [protein-PII] uridylyltransferase [Janthinobacterium lividum]MDQ4676393.1 [protein-PII] uridylyltransferase [Janthinobacterium lividum]MDQ4688683.1 [protein-PII] uridylyltransferase [Janthinobacterium lividum]
MKKQVREQLKQQLKADRQVVIAAFQADGKPEKLLRSLRHSVDGVLARAWQEAGLPPGTALVGVGGYGRGELFPYSDVDLLILLQQAPDAATQEKLEELVQLLWDLGLEIGHSIRTVDECMVESKADITVQTSLLEARLVCGNADLFAQLQQCYDAAMEPQAFFQAKTAEMRQRHAKYEDTAFSLEPNCKESPGGLRDLQVILWVAKAAGLANSWRTLATGGLITLTEARQLMEKERAFKDIRVRLHLHAGRREDRLVFDVQTAIAESLGLQATGSGPHMRRASEFLMQRYYWAAKTVTQLNTILLQNIEARLFPQDDVAVPINERFNEVNSLIDISADDTFEQYPSAMLEVFVLMTERPALKGMTSRATRALWHARFKIDGAFRQDPVNRALFLRIMQAPVGIIHALRRMNEMSILGRYLPNFRRIVGQMQHDLFHVYTVDQHILMVVRNMRRFTMSEHAHEYPFCSQLMADFSQSWLLYVAALFHDIAKGRGGDHSKLGVADATQFCQDHGLSAEDTELVAFLVENHLTMSQVAQKQDLSDPDVIAAFAKVVKDERHLTGLYLLTVADIRGTSPKVWNAWKGKLLEDLYKITLRVLGGEPHTADRELKNRQQEALATLRLYGLPPDAHLKLWQQLDVAYFLRHDASDIAWQTRSLYDKLDSKLPVVKCRLAPIGEGLQVAVYIPDQPDLFARICSYFDRKNFSILDAKIHTTKNGYALDTFLVTEQNFAKSYRDIISLIEHELGELLQSQTPLPPPGKGRLSRLSRTFPFQPTVDLRPDEKGQYYLLSVAANDRTGLLYAIANVLTKYRINLHTAKIMTLGERVEDVFLVDGPALNNARNQILLETDLLDALKV